MVRPRDDVHRDPYQEGVHRKLHHWMEALKGQLSTSDKEPLIRGIQAYRDKEQRLQKVHCSVQVDQK